MAVQALLRNVTFRSISDNPSITPRTVRLTLTDGDGGTSNLPTKTITINPVNDAPLIAAFDTPVIYTENAAGQVLDANVLVTDIDSASLDTGKLTIQLLSNAQTTDRLEIRHQGVTAGKIGVTGNSITFGGASIGRSGANFPRACVPNSRSFRCD